MVEFPAHARLSGCLDAQHLINTVMLDNTTLASDKIVVLVIEYQRPWADHVSLPASLQLHLFAQIPLEILKRDLRIAVDRLVNFIHIVVDGLVHGFDSAGDQYLAVQLLRLRLAGQIRQLLYELTRFPLRNKARCQNGIDEQLQFGELELPVADIVVGIAATLFRNHIDAEVAKSLKIGIYGPPLKGNSLSAHFLDELLQRESVILIRLLEQNLHQI